MKNYNTIFEKGQHKILACVESVWKGMLEVCGYLR